MRSRRGLEAQGETLAERVRAGGPLPLEQATRVLRDAARGVGFAHARGVIHGNLKPENILIERGTGRVLVMDLGVAIGPEAPAAVKPPGDGGDAAAAYLAPELVGGGAPDEQTDVYALGAIGYFAVTGAVPGDGETSPEIFETSRYLGRPPVLRVYGANRNRSYAHAVESCLCRDRWWRLRNAQELADWLTGDEPASYFGLPKPLRWFLGDLRRRSADNSGTLLVAVFTAGALILGLAVRNWAAVGFSAAGLALLATVPIRAVMLDVSMAFHRGYRPPDLLRALSQQVEWERDRLVSRYGSGWNAPGRVAGRLAYAGLGLAGVGAALSFATAVPPHVGLGAMVLGAATATVAALVGWFRARRRQVPLALWLRFWKSRVGEWLLRSEAWWVGPPRTRQPPEIAMLDAPSYEEIQWEASRDLVNLVPAVRHLARSRIRRIRSWMAGTLQGQDRLDARWTRVRRNLRDGVAMVEQLLGRLQADQTGGDLERLIQDFDAVMELSQALDGVFESARRLRGAAPGQ